MRIARYTILPAALTLAVAACSSDPESSQSEVAAAPAATSGEKLSANNAGEAELEAAGISNASQWAHKVEEYRPYPEDDPNFNKLRGELAKYNPGPGVVDAIIDLLQLP